VLQLFGVTAPTLAQTKETQTKQSQTKTAQPATTSASDNPTSFWEAEHQRAVELAQHDQHDAALAILSKLMTAHPDNYPIRRDYVVVLAWKGDCDESIRQYEPIKTRSDQEPYLVSAVAECLAKLRNTDEALTLLDKNLKAHPDDEDLKASYASLREQTDLNNRPLLEVTVGTDQSDAGIRERYANIRYSQYLAPATRWFARYYTANADDKDFATGDLHRLGLGIMYWINPQWYFEQEFSAEIINSDKAGSTSTLIYYPTSLWEIRGQYATFAEDISLRANAQDIYADKFTLAADFHTLSYQWEWSGEYDKYHFSDDNDRESLSTSLGYAYMQQEKLENRVILELSHSTNTLDNVVYFSPASDATITVTHRTSFVYDSQYDRHVDHLSLFAGEYDQQHYSSKPIYGIRYEQEYDFNKFHSFSWGAEYASRVYDGNRESGLNVIAKLTSKL